MELLCKEVCSFSVMEAGGHTFEKGPQRTITAKFGLVLHKGCKGEDSNVQIVWCMTEGQQMPNDDES